MGKGFRRSLTGFQLRVYQKVAVKLLFGAVFIWRLDGSQRIRFQHGSLMCGGWQISSFPCQLLGGAPSVPSHVDLSIQLLECLPSMVAHFSQSE